MDGIADTDFGLIAETASFLCYFNMLQDDRQAGKVVYPLNEVLLLSLLAVLAGAESFAGIARFGEKKLKLLRRFPPFADGTPPRDTLGDIFATLDAEAFRRRFVDWVAALTKTPVEVIAIDGKTVRRSGSKAKSKAPIHMVHPIPLATLRAKRSNLRLEDAALFGYPTISRRWMASLRSP